MQVRLYSFIFFVMTLHLHAKLNELTQVFHHESMLGDKIAFYFTQDPIFNRLPNKLGEQIPKNVEMVTFFVPMTTISTKTQEMVNQINKTNYPFFTINIESAAKPVPGVRINLSYQKEAIIFGFEQFDAIHTHKGLLFHFYNKSKLDELQHKTDSLLKTAQNRPHKIVIDCGHGGSDCGKIGQLNVKEKEITLDVGLQVHKLLAQQGYNSELTRSDDTFVKLDQRTSIANRMQADLFVSLHANAAARESVCGLETYYCDPRITSNVSKQSPLIDSWYSHKNQESFALAQAVHTHIISQAKTMYNLVDRCVKQANAQVLIGTDMPAILIELGFLTNSEDAKILNTPSYKKLIAQAIVKGIDTYYKTKIL